MLSLIWIVYQTKIHPQEACAAAAEAKQLEEDIAKNLTKAKECLDEATKAVAALDKVGRKTVGFGNDTQ